MAKICICDTNDEDIEQLQLILESSGHVFVPAFSVQDATQLLMSDEPYDLFAVELHLEGIDRREMANALKTIHDYVPVLGLTSEDPNNRTSLVMAQYFSGVITKPLDRIPVIATIESLLGLGRIRDKISDKLT